jgi:hypothetical protein
LIERIAMNHDFWPKSTKIDKFDDFIAIERTITGLINRDLIGDFQAILIRWVPFFSLVEENISTKRTNIEREEISSVYCMY